MFKAHGTNNRTLNSILIIAKKNGKIYKNLHFGEKYERSKYIQTVPAQEIREKVAGRQYSSMEITKKSLSAAVKKQQITEWNYLRL